MTTDNTRPLTLNVPVLTRVEGEGGLTVRIRGTQVEQAQLKIYEPPRLFESLLRGRPLQDAPDITARICGICPVAYQMSAVHALEAALEIHITPEVRRLRRLMYCGEWIESHALHMHLLQAPDFFDEHSGIDLAKRFPQEVQRGLRLKKFGNELLEVLGGRAIHPINAAVGGFHRWPDRDALARLIPHFEWGVTAAIDATRWVTSLPFPQVQTPGELVSLSHPDEYPMNEGRMRTSSGLCCDVADYPLHFQEVQVPHSTALHSVRLPDRSTYLVGPLARLTLSSDRLVPEAKRLVDELHPMLDPANPFHGIVARGIEVVHAYAEALSILRDYRRPPGPSCLTAEPRVATGSAATEAPRGTIYHRYAIDAEGRITDAVIIPPTSQNQGQIERDLVTHLQTALERGERDQQTLAVQCERLVRCYDPCISCSTHFLSVRWEVVE